MLRMFEKIGLIHSKNGRKSEQAQTDKKVEQKTERTRCESCHREITTETDSLKSNSETGNTDKESDKEFEIISDADIDCCSPGSERSINYEKEVDTDRITQELSSAFLAKLLQLLKDNRFSYQIRYYKDSKIIFITSRKEFEIYVLNCPRRQIFKAGKFTNFDRQMVLRGFEAVNDLRKQFRFVRDDAIGYKTNNQTFIRLVEGQAREWWNEPKKSCDEQLDID